jgi:dynein heavy chain 2
MLKQMFFPIKLSLLLRNYDVKAFRNDLKEVLKKAGVEGKPMLLFMEDYQLLDPSFLEYINSLLSGGKFSVSFNFC